MSTPQISTTTDRRLTPLAWTKPDTGVHLVDVGLSSEEGAEVIARWVTGGLLAENVRRVLRIENGDLFRRFRAAASASRGVEFDHRGRSPQLLTLFHGTHPQTAERIAVTGFDARFSRSPGGLYFSSFSSHSRSYSCKWGTASHPEGLVAPHPPHMAPEYWPPAVASEVGVNGVYTMLLCHVFPGCPGQNGQIGTLMNQYIVPHGEWIYPAFLIRFTNATP